MEEPSPFEKSLNHYINIINGVVSAVIISLLVWVGTEVSSLGKEQSAMKQKSDLMWTLIVETRTLPSEVANVRATMEEVKERLSRMERNYDSGGLR
jgi:hypothetical protein